MRPALGSVRQTDTAVWARHLLPPHWAVWSESPGCQRFILITGAERARHVGIWHWRSRCWRELPGAAGSRGCASETHLQMKGLELYGTAAACVCGAAGSFLVLVRGLREPLRHHGCGTVAVSPLASLGPVGLWGGCPGAASAPPAAEAAKLLKSSAQKMALSLAWLCLLPEQFLRRGQRRGEQCPCESLCQLVWCLRRYFWILLLKSK